MVSMRDIAKIAKVSVASVSRILNEDPTFSINENTRRRVIEIANELQYKKNKVTRSPKNINGMMTIGLITRHGIANEHEDPYFQDIRRGILLEASKWRIQVKTIFSLRDKIKNWDELKEFKIIIIIGEVTNRLLQKIEEYNKNIILIDSNRSTHDCIQNDFKYKTMEILNLLYSKGHKNIAFIGGKANMVDIDGNKVGIEEPRSQSYIEWMKLHDLTEYINVFQGSWGSESAIYLTEQLLALPSRPTAIIAASDPMAIGIYKCLNNSNIKIPNDISIVSFDDIDMAQYMSPSLSTVHIDAEKMGRLAAILAKEYISGFEKMPIKIICSSVLEVRESIKEIF
ncbi:LacI family DNA-binding transcriptional regulator [Ligilactobacillus sp. Marseille-Q7487]|uniref:LacI family DNA-binding transcriptional regulator n=1 Tax=Ligilactobacillus sp. Marseille-Q7487 TaxID=3022128 RepID=UPI0024A9E8D3|nr:LacI family DNA-binding transcriptional regulator [Ligilactobacillus sp. Marseille-Q7487]